MYNGCNKTALCSQKTIAEGFIDLLKEKEYSKITASEICKRSGVSRQTFYTLFSSKENIISFILLKEYSFNPSQECNCSGHPTLSELSKGFASFIIQKSDFIDLLEKNNIIYLMQESLYYSFGCCDDDTDKNGSYDDLNVPCGLTVDFIAAGLTTIAKHYVKNKSGITCAELEKIIYMLFSGTYLEL